MEFGAPVWHAFGMTWPERLFPYQREGVERLIGDRAALLADEMGLGKTVQAIAALRILAARGEAAASLVVAPSGLVLQWRRQFRHWAPDMTLSTVIGSASDRLRAWRARAHVFIVSYEALRADMWLKGAWTPSERHWAAVVLDEAQRIKTADSDLARAVKRLRRSRSWALTGTPLENCLDDLISILDFAAPGRFDPSQKAIGLRRLLAEVQIRRRRRDVLPDLPPKSSSTVQLDLGRHQRAAYVRAESEGLVRLEALGRDLRITHVLELILRLKQICNFCPETGESTKLDDLRGRLQAVTAAGEKALIFSQFVEEPFGARRLKREFRDFDPLLLTGDLEASTRALRIATFEREANRPVMVLSLRAGGVGLNLTSASYVFHFDRWWNPAVEAQAEDRVHRIGQQKPVHTYAYLCGDTIEERIQEILMTKRVLFADVVDGVAMNALRRLDLDTLLEAVRGTISRNAGAGVGG
jgi:SNF2 family DNA or RNA helicase